MTEWHAQDIAVGDPLEIRWPDSPTGWVDATIIRLTDIQITVVFSNHQRWMCMRGDKTWRKPKCWKKSNGHQ